MNDPVQSLVNAAFDVLKYFRCPDEYLLKPLMHMHWCIREGDGLSILTYWSATDAETSLVVVKKNGSPQLYKTRSYTMVVAIDCIKIGFIFDNRYEK